MLGINDRACLVTELNSPFYRQSGISVGVLRLDRIHPEISGNKWFKLLPLIRRLEAGERLHVLSFGGVWSNHLHALAFLGKSFGIRTLGLVRGHEAQADTAMLRDARSWGMVIRFLDRDTYAQRGAASMESWLASEYPGWERLPEGGSNRHAVEGCREIWRLLEGSAWHCPDYVASALGTGGTLAGIIAGKPEATRVIGVPVLKLGESAVSQVRTLLADAGCQDPGGWELDQGGSFGGYARLPASLAAFIRLFEERCRVPLDPVYTGKLFAAIHRRIVKGEIEPGASILLLHTGGLQGRRGMEARIERGASAFQGPQPL
ncbi:1-aminocyclopropane-1-carboxylate deaminase/D-cysteine desulfhydrase [Marinobacterium sp. YM272]|uniref:1-aminocyclopropane-1-carboxylate deaminase/D-cysteine desulfhydrase n=1 Tax=Marinobacterium sp. YM272 TaxID=3421654 RepID=UPI003D7F6A16